MARVLNKKRDGMPVGAVYVGRPSKWGNPFVIGRDGTRPEVIAKYRDWLLRNERLMADLRELRGKDLVCWCAPPALPRGSAGGNRERPGRGAARCVAAR